MYDSLFPWIHRHIVMMIACAILCATLVARAANGQSATFDRVGTVTAAEMEGVSRLLNEDYLQALQTLDSRGIETWRTEEMRRTRDNLARTKSAVIPRRSAVWMDEARRFTHDYAGEQARLARLSQRAASEIHVYASERAGWELPDRTLVMSFDDGPDPSSTPAILRTLRALQVPAVFFVLGNRLQAIHRPPDYHGFTVGSHTWDHRALAGAPLDAVASELDRTAREMVGAHLPSPRLFRPPYGALRQRELDLVEKRGMRAILWNIDSQDWQTAMQHTPGRLRGRVVALALLRRHGIILCHDIQLTTAAALPSFLRDLRALGFQFAQPY